MQHELFIEAWKANALETPNSPLVRGQEFDVSVCDAFEHVSKTKK